MQKYNGLINVSKEAGYTSFDVVAKLRGILQMRKIGHTGTLDPNATGVLVVCLGKATKVCDLITDKTKEYIATFTLGITTDTQDISGNILQQRFVCVSEADIQKVTASYVGKQQQIPPMYSAKKVDGKKLYEYARKGECVERKPAEIELFEIELLQVTSLEVQMRVVCSKGTYIRTLINDIGETLGCGAVMTHLIRSKVGGFTLEDAYTLKQIEDAVKQDTFKEILLPIDKVFSYPSGIISPEASTRAINGNPLVLREISFDKEESQVVLSEEYQSKVSLFLASGEFVGIYKIKDDICHLDKMFLDKE